MLGDVSISTKKTIAKICKFYCKQTHVRAISKSFKDLECFSCKTKTPEYLWFYAVYEFVCNASYIRETQRHIKTRYDEHLCTDKKSHVFQHLAGNYSCKFKCNESYFKVIYTTSSALSLNVKESLYKNQH